MKTLRLLAPLAASLILIACGSSSGNEAVPAPEDSVSATNNVGSDGRQALTSAPAPEGGSAEIPDDGYPDLTPAQLSTEAERGEAGARNVLLSFARAIEMREVGQAHAMLSARAKEHFGGGSFAAMFEGLQDLMVAVPDGTMEGAAGTSYYTSEATITARDAQGRPVRLEGPIVLSRVNDVPGASAEQLRWKIDSISLTQTH